jgi:hypothetical protein
MKGWLVLLGTIIHSLSVFSLLAAPDPGATLSISVETYPFLTNVYMTLQWTGETEFGHAIEYSADLQNWTPVATNFAFESGIDVDHSAEMGFFRVRRGPFLPSFGALTAIGMITLNANNVSIDSYDSTDPNYSTNGLYDVSRRKDNGDVISSSASTNAISIANCIIAGHIKTGPGGSISNKSLCSVGSLVWVDARTPGIQPGYASDDMNSEIPDVILPNVSWTLAGGAGTGDGGMAPDGKTYAHIFTSAFDTALNPGNYTITDEGDIYVGTNVTVRLNITTNLFIPANIFVAGATTNEAGKMIVYLNGPSFVALNQNIKTQSGLPQNLTFMGMRNLTSIAYQGTGNFTGIIYAPEADLTLLGGAPDTVDICGSFVAKTIKVNGHYNIHFDESLKW